MDQNNFKAENIPFNPKLFQPTISLKGLNMLKKERRTYYILIVIALVLGRNELDFIILSSILYMLSIGSFTLNKYLRDHPNLSIDSPKDLVRLNMVNYIFLFISVLNLWDSEFHKYLTSNILLVVYGLYLFQFMLISSLIFLQLGKMGGNLNLMQPSKYLLKDKKSFILAFLGLIFLSMGQAGLSVLILIIFSKYSLMALFIINILQGSILYFLIRVKKILPVRQKIGRAHV